MLHQMKVNNCLMIAVFFTLSALAQKEDSRGGVNDFELVKTTTLQATLDVVDETVSRTDYGVINFDLFDDSMGRLVPGDAIELNLFTDTLHLGVLREVVHNASGTLTWLGYLDDVENGSITLVIDHKEGVVAGSIVMPGKMYKIRWAGNGVHALQEIDTNRFPPDAEPIIVFSGEEEEKEENQPFPLSFDASSSIDVLVVYTAAARSAEGGTSAINALVDLAIVESNTSYNNSGVNFQLNLVHKEEVSYTESSDFSTNLSRLTSKTDGYIDNVHALRDQHCADVVALIIEGTQYCGMAYLMANVSASFESSAFSVTARTCATGYFSFGHELGHNMGAHHDWYVDSGTSPYIYNHGYVNVADKWRTIMAYNTECSDSSVNCTRLQYWSNPNVTYGGDPMGVSGSIVGSSAYNAQVLNNTASTVANFRDSTGTCSGGCEGDGYSGSLTGTGDEEFEPNGTYYYSSGSGSHTAELTGPGGADFDLYLWKWDGSAWITVASSLTPTSTESISYSGSAGYYSWRIHSSSGLGGYDLCTTRP